MPTKKKAPKKAVHPAKRFEVSGRNKDGDLISRNIRYTEENANKLKKKISKRKVVKEVSVKTVK